MLLLYIILGLSVFGFIISGVVVLFPHERKFWWFFLILFALIFGEVLLGLPGGLLVYLGILLLILSKFWRFGTEFWLLQGLSVFLNLCGYLSLLNGHPDFPFRETFLFFFCMGLLVEEFIAHGSGATRLNREILVLWRGIIGFLGRIFILRYCGQKVKRFMEIID